MKEFIKKFFLFGLLAALGIPQFFAEATAEIIIQQGGYSLQYGLKSSVVVNPVVINPLVVNPLTASMPSIVFGQPVMLGSPSVLHAHAWSAYQRNNNASGTSLILKPYTGTETEEQMSLNRNMSRAQAFRLGY